ncbi:hypothetical protein MC7420_4534 [Coleofasciculus chthonoplastes PCC 7420]|uniref:Uncharacterized protein n=1 Tax=Coleofasciculus chthonoplastes PCC 7420 TaxID=118168 RepID=B4VNY8_9CYAN|nr:hypothetical protein MC7420_4534 [Coleofasciculus chthonoplastes PCC 7420]
MVRLVQRPWKYLSSFVQAEERGSGGDVYCFVISAFLH